MGNSVDNVESASDDEGPCRSAGVITLWVSDVFLMSRFRRGLKWKRYSLLEHLPRLFYFSTKNETFEEENDVASGMRSNPTGTWESQIGSEVYPLWVNPLWQPWAGLIRARKTVSVVLDFHFARRWSPTWRFGAYGSRVGTAMRRFSSGFPTGVI